MRKAFGIIALASAAILAPTPSYADGITYSVNTAIGTDIVTGTITTDGKIGQLTPSDITAYSLSDSENLLGTINRNNSDPSSGSFTIPLIATPTQIIDAATEQANFQIISTATGGLLDFQDDAWLILASNHALDTQTLVVPGAVLANVPELNPSSGTSAFVIVVGAALIIRGRRKLPTA